LLQRGAQGQVRSCHGDLHLGNVAMIGGRPVLFDALEFDDRIASCDVLYDLAFLVMDLGKLGRAADAKRLLDRYIALSENKPLQVAGLAAFPMFLSLRAAIRAKVAAALFRLDRSKAGLKTAAQAYLTMALDALAVGA
jgi:aminoglycoside phosphotransferase family enzyme